MTRPYTRFTKKILCLLGIGINPCVYAVSVPSTLPLNPRIHQSIDPEFAAWLSEYAEAPNPLEMTDEVFNGFASQQKPVESAFLKLLRVQKTADSVVAVKKDERIKQIADARSVVHAELQLAANERHRLLGLLASLIRDIDPQGASDELQQAIGAEPEYACSQKSSKLEISKRPYFEQASHQDILELISTAQSYESLTHRRKLLDAIATAMPERRRAEFAPALQQAGGNLPILMRRHQWLQNDEADSNPSDPWQLASRYARKKDCHKATKEFQSVIAQRKVSLEETIEVAVPIEQCWRTQQRSSAVSYWTSMKPVLTAKFGEIGGLWADLRQGYLLWAADRNQEASVVYQKVLQDAEGKENTTALRAKATYTLGKISESDNDFQKAIDRYAYYVANFPNSEDFEFALNGLVVARASKGEWRELIPSLKEFLDQQSLLALDQRPVGNMAFCLFWLGRAYLSLGQGDLAKEMWRRLAAEYYSTFYGAMGHFLLEQSSGRVFALEPSRVSGFKMEPLLAALDSKQKDVVTRTLQLLRLGMRDQARCEAEELNGAEKDKASPDVRLVRALVLHASGAWLEAIRIFDAMPRSVRSSLPVGFERILFPRRYSEIVNRYAAKVGLDPDLVFAVMRQESVFAKEAMSPVGAMGLMQLMPSTASLELGKLPKNYVNQQRRSELHHLLADGTNLFDPDVNITLGVHHLARLLQIYKSPVFALTSYNASPAATLRWKKTIASDDLLTFIERIPYKETRAYVKLILRNYFYYKRWYGPSQVMEDKHLESIAQDLIAMTKNPPKPTAN